MRKAILILAYIFLEYEGVQFEPPSLPPEKTTIKKAIFIRFKSAKKKKLKWRDHHWIYCKTRRLEPSLCCFFISFIECVEESYNKWTTYNKSVKWYWESILIQLHSLGSTLNQFDILSLKFIFWNNYINKWREAWFVLTSNSINHANCCDYICNEV